MTEDDMFFTHTIVGSALSVHLGQAAVMPAGPSPGLQVNMRNAGTSLDQVWKDWILVQGAYPYVGLPRRAPSALRRKIERYSLLIGALGLALSLGALTVIVVTIGLPMLSR
jgi:hypothetical protein